MAALGRGVASRPRGIPGMRCRPVWILAMCMFMVAFSAVHGAWALQRHTLLPERSGEQTATAPDAARQQTAASTPAPQGAQESAAPATGGGDATSQQPPGQPSSVPKSAEPHATPAPSLSRPVQPTQEAPHGEEAHGDAHGGHGPVLPEISPIPGVTFVETMIELLDYELKGRFLGWRPNDILLGRFTDNVNNYQLGVLEAIRFTTLRLKDSLTRMGDADTYDPDLELAVNLLMNRATLFWFPSAETSYGEAIQHLRQFVQKLDGGKRNFYYRVDNLRLLIASYKDLLGNVNKSLIVSPVSMFKTDDYFYYAKGVAHVYYEILKVIRVGFRNQLASTMNGLELMDEILHELHRVEELDPWLILDSDLDGLMANHRANLNAPLSEVTHLLGILSTF